MKNHDGKILFLVNSILQEQGQHFISLVIGCLDRLCTLFIFRALVITKINNDLGPSESSTVDGFHESR
jgi:hypothetical protein